MMKVLSVLFLALLPSVALGKNLRKAEPAQAHDIDNNLSPKAAPVELTPRSYSQQYREHIERRHRRLDAATINAGVAAALPALNTAFQNVIPDPIPIGLSYSNTFNDGTTCEGQTITASSTIVEISGVSSTEIVKLEVDDSTDTFTAGCGTSSFTGEFIFETTATNGYSLTGTTDFSASGTTTLCTTTTSSGYTGTINNPKFTGRVYLEGDITCNTATITKAEVREIGATCDSQTVSFTGSLGDYANIATSSGNDLGTELKNYVSTTLTTLVQGYINDGLDQATARLGFGGGVPFLLSFYRDAAETQVALLQNEAQTIIQGWQNQASNFAGNFGFTVGGGPNGPNHRLFL